MGKIPHWAQNLGLALFFPSFGFFCFSMFTWRGFYLVERDSPIPWMQMLSDEEFASIYWWNYAVLGLTIVCLAIAVIGIVLYVFADNPQSEAQKTE